MKLPELGERVPKRGNRLTRALSHAFMRGLGWRIEGTLPNLSKVLIVGAPHTTAWDFVIAMATIHALGLGVSWLGIDWIFHIPFMRALGGVPVERGRAQGLVGQSIEQFRTREKFFLGIAPEGSRKKVAWKKGFYRIAHGAGVPLFLVAIDHRDKFVHLGPVFEPSGDYEADMEKIRAFYGKYVERHPDRFTV